MFLNSQRSNDRQRVDGKSRRHAPASRAAGAALPMRSKQTRDCWNPRTSAAPAAGVGLRAVPCGGRGHSRSIALPAVPPVGCCAWSWLTSVRNRAPPAHHGMTACRRARCQRGAIRSRRTCRCAPSPRSGSARDPWVRRTRPDGPPPVSPRQRRALSQRRQAARHAWLKWDPTRAGGFRVTGAQYRDKTGCFQEPATRHPWTVQGLPAALRL